MQALLAATLADEQIVLVLLQDFGVSAVMEHATPGATESRGTNDVQTAIRGEKAIAQHYLADSPVGQKEINGDLPLVLDLENSSFLSDAHQPGDLQFLKEGERIHVVDNVRGGTGVQDCLCLASIIARAFGCEDIIDQS